MKLCRKRKITELGKNETCFMDSLYHEFQHFFKEELRSRNVDERWMDDSLGIGMSLYFVLDTFFFSKKFFNLNSI